MKNFGYGSGMIGCLFDYGPHFTSDRSEDSLQGVIDDFLEIFGDALSDQEYTDLAKNLREDGIHYFSNPIEAGAQYCEVYEYEMSKKEWKDYQNSY